MAALPLCHARRKMLAVPCQVGAWFTAWHGIAVDVLVAELVAALGVFFFFAVVALSCGVGGWPHSSA